MLRTLEDDFARLPGLLAPEPAPEAKVIQFPVTVAVAAATPQEQLGLF